MKKYILLMALNLTGLLICCNSDRDRYLLHEPDANKAIVTSRDSSCNTLGECLYTVGLRPINKEEITYVAVDKLTFLMVAKGDSVEYGKK